MTKVFSNQRLIVALLVSLSTAACRGAVESSGGAGQDQEGGATHASAAAAGDFAPEAKSLPDISEAECREFAASIEAAVPASHDGDLKAFIDWDHLIDEAMRDVDLPGDKGRRFRQGLRAGLMESGDIFSQIAAKGGRYDLLRVHQRDNRWRAMFRLLLPDSGVNYHDLIIRRHPRGDLKVADIYVFVAGENFSQTMRRSCLQWAAHENRTLWERLKGKEQAYVKHVAEVQAIAQALRLQRPEQCLNIYHGLPAELQNDKTLLVMRVMAATMAENDGELKAAFELLQSRYPGDACLDLMSIDYHLTRGEFQKASAAVDRLDKAVGIDPYLDAMRASIVLLQEDFALAEKLANAVIEYDPSLMEPYWIQVSIMLKRQDHQQTLHWLMRIDQAFAMDWVDLTLEPEYAGFVASPEHQDWLAYLAES